MREEWGRWRKPATAKSISLCRYDTDGNEINVRDGGILCVDGVYHWYGMQLRGLPCDSKGRGGQTATSGVAMYASTDLERSFGEETGLRGGIRKSGLGGKAEEEAANNAPPLVSTRSGRRKRFPDRGIGRLSSAIGRVCRRRNVRLS